MSERPSGDLIAQHALSGIRLIGPHQGVRLLLAVFVDDLDRGTEAHLALLRFARFHDHGGIQPLGEEANATVDLA